MEKKLYANSLYGKKVVLTFVVFPSEFLSRTSEELIGLIVKDVRLFIIEGAQALAIALALFVQTDDFSTKCQGFFGSFGHVLVDIFLLFRGNHARVDCSVVNPEPEFDHPLVHLDTCAILDRVLDRSSKRLRSPGPLFTSY